MRSDSERRRSRRARKRSIWPRPSRAIESTSANAVPRPPLRDLGCAALLRALRETKTTRAASRRANATAPTPGPSRAGRCADQEQRRGDDRGRGGQHAVERRRRPVSRASSRAGGRISGQAARPRDATSRSCGQSGMDILARRGRALARRRIERAHGLGRLPAQRPDELSVVLVGDLARAVVELELLQRRESPVALLEELQPFLLVGSVRRGGRLRLRLREERRARRTHRRRRRAGRRARRRGSPVTRRASAPRRTAGQAPLLARVRPQGDERPEDEQETGEPDELTSWIDQRLTKTEPSGLNWLAMTKRSSARSQSERIATSFDVCSSAK